MNLSNRRWPLVVVGAGFLLMGVLHFLTWQVLIFVHRANVNPEADLAYIPLYGLLGTPAVWILFVTIILDVLAGVLLLATRSRGRLLILISAIANLPLIPLGPIIGSAGLLVLYLNRTEPRMSSKAGS